MWTGCTLALHLLCLNFWLYHAWQASHYVFPVPDNRLDATVPGLNAWIFWWNAEHFLSGGSHYWNAPIFYPAQGALAFSEPQPIFILASPLIATCGLIRAYTIWLSVQILLNGLATVWVLRTFQVSWPATLIGSLSVLGLPIVWQNLDAVQLVALWPMLGCIGFAWKLHRQPTGSNAVGLGGAMVFLAATSLHQCLFFFVCCCPSIVWLIPTRQRAGWCGWMAFGLALATAGVAPIAWPMQQIHQEYGFARSAQTQQALSASWEDWLSVTSPGTLNPGWLGILLAFCAIGLWALPPARQTSQPSEASLSNGHMLALLATLTGSSWVLSFGLNLQIGWINVWQVLSSVVTPLASARSLFRFAYITQLSLMLLMAIGLDGIGKCFWLKLADYGWSLGHRRFWLGCFGLTVCSGLFGTWPRQPVRLISTAALSPAPGWATRLSRLYPGTPIVCLPFAEGLTPRSLESQVHWMLYATIHRHPMLNGYSGFFPRSWFENAERLARPPMKAETLDYLAQLNVRLIVVDRRRWSFVGSQSLADPPGTITIGNYHLERIDTEGSIEIWQLDAP